MDPSSIPLRPKLYRISQYTYSDSMSTETVLDASEAPSPSRELSLFTNWFVRSRNWFVSVSSSSSSSTDTVIFIPGSSLANSSFLNDHLHGRSELGNLSPIYENLEYRVHGQLQQFHHGQLQQFHHGQQQQSNHGQQQQIHHGQLQQFHHGQQQQSNHGQQQQSNQNPKQTWEYSLFNLFDYKNWRKTFFTLFCPCVLEYELARTLDSEVNKMLWQVLTLLLVVCLVFGFAAISSLIGKHYVLFCTCSTLFFIFLVQRMLFVTILRKRLRKMWNISGVAFLDCCVVSFFYPCTLLQMKQELDSSNQTPTT